MAKVAKLVTMVITTRIVVEDYFDDEQVIEAAQNQVIEKVHSEYQDNIDSVTTDIECPYNPELDD